MKQPLRPRRLTKTEKAKLKMKMVKMVSLLTVSLLTAKAEKEAQ